ncbi:CidA/LrgA family protein [Lampropedia puyangensis]|uniref:CidA/LrgA family protein n=1 Tax=Lampropedia puyangensis TaxID=1330072 RepID=A0A4S8F8S3_9BURK|nr:CidA/LrgA family protein [Lampropedia puyangensis]THU03639.1 CidA/LrgA family protein [Lampropedia puyangensis]
MQHFSSLASRFTLASLRQSLLRVRQLSLPELGQSIAQTAAFQIALLIGVWWLAARAAGWFGLAQLGNVVGMLALWLLLINNRLRLARVQAGAHWLIKHMLLFFIPAVLVVLDHQELLGWVGVKLFFIIVLGTLVVMACTALSIEWYLRLVRHRKALRRLRTRQLRPHAENRQA